jgi:hypothetical protein
VGPARWRERGIVAVYVCFEHDAINAGDPLQSKPSSRRVVDGRRPLSTSDHGELRGARIRDVGARARITIARRRST